MKRSTSVASTEASTKYWRKLSQTCLTDKEVELVADHLNWELASEYANLSKKTWKEYGLHVHYEKFALNRHVTAELFNELDHLPNWTEMEEKRDVDDDFLLQINTYYFRSVEFAAKNPSAKRIKDETWQELMKRNGKELLRTSDPNERSDMLNEQFVSMSSLDHYRKIWSWADWKVISAKQRLNFEFIKKNWIFLHTRSVKEKNRVHQLSKEELKEIREFVSNEIEQQIKDGNEPSWKLLYEQQLLTREFLEKYKEKFAGILVMYDME